MLKIYNTLPLYNTYLTIPNISPAVKLDIVSALINGGLMTPSQIRSLLNYTDIPNNTTLKKQVESYA